MVRLGLFIFSRGSSEPLPCCVGPIALPPARVRVVSGLYLEEYDTKWYGNGVETPQGFGWFARMQWLSENGNCT